MKRTRLPFATVSGRKHAWRWLMPVLLLLLFISTMLWLPWQTQRMESHERQEQLIADTLWVEQTIRFQLSRNEESLRLVGNEILSGYLSAAKWNERILPLLRNSHELERVMWLDAAGNEMAAAQNIPISLSALPSYSEAALEHVKEARIPQYNLPLSANASGPVLLQYYVPLFSGSHYRGSLVATYTTASILDELVPWWFAQENEIALANLDDVVLDKRAAGGPGRGVYTHRRALDLPGISLALHTNSTKSAPKLLPGLLAGSVVALSIGLLWSLGALWRDINRRLAAEGALRQEVAFRTAMENSLMTGLRARDMEGRITYVNPAFCQMVGMSAAELVGRAPPMPYWAAETREEAETRFSRASAGKPTSQFETSFQHANGERFPVMVFESPLLDDAGRQTGWMGSILDISELKRIENINRQQQEKLQLSARLASMGEIASTLAHELTQPLAAISSYTTGALNLVDSNMAQGGRLDSGMLRSALEKASAQAQRAGHIIRSVHAFVKKREPAREPVAVRDLLDTLLPLIELQARQSFVTIQLSLAPGLQPASADRVMLEQVLLNLTRNAIEAMQEVPRERRILRIAAVPGETESGAGMLVSVIDQGHGISDETAQRLFSPFFSTKAEGMGMGLNICRTVIESHGGTLSHARNPEGGTIFRFWLPALSNNAGSPGHLAEEAATREPGTAALP